MHPTSLDVTVLRVLATLSRSGDDELADVLDPTRGGRPLVWLGPALGPRFPDSQVSFGPLSFAAVATGAIPVQADLLDRAATLTLKRLAALDALHREERMLRLGWVFVVATMNVDGVERQLRHPLVSVPVRCRTGLETVLSVAGDIELSPLVPAHLVAGFEASIPEVDLTGWEVTSRSLQRFPTLVAWVREVTASMGLADVELTGADPRLAAPPSGRPTAAIGYGIYQSRDVTGTSLATALRNWAGRGMAGRTAFSHVLGSAAGSSPGPPQTTSPAPAPGEAAEGPPLRVTKGQLEAVQRSRHAPVTVISGAPGSGKTHAACAVALDAVSRGEHVLIATQTVHASEVLTRMLEASPGPDPVVFGGNEATGRLRRKLADGLDDEVPPSTVAALEREVAAAHDEVTRIRGAITEMLTVEAAAGRVLDEAWQSMLPVRRIAAPGAFDSELTDRELDDLADRAATATRQGGRWWERWRARRADRAVRSAVRASSSTSLDALVDAIAAARDLRASARLAGTGGTRVGALWEALEAAETRHDRLRGDLLVSRCRSGPARGPAARRAAQELALALRRGRMTRRDNLAAIDPGALLAALPLWVGTLRDIEDLLPQRPAMFDLVILDEASQIDLPNAATALLRARRAVVVGDPRQLRHVSFVSDDDITTALAEHGVTHLSDRLDVRRLSAFDASTAVAPPIRLDEHFRSVPHLIGFSARHFYDDELHIATRHPRNESTDVIEVVHVAGTRGEDGVNRAEVDAVERVLRDLDSRGHSGIGVISPLRAQADALESMLLDRFDLEDIERLGLRVGTVHAFQGSERETTILSPAVDPSSPAGSLRFVQDPHLFNVMVTRARTHSVVVTSFGGDAPSPPPGLLADYLHHAEVPPRPPAGVAEVEPWVDRLAAELTRAGLRCRLGYPVGRWTVDLCVGDGDGAVAIECRVHPHGVGAHLERRGQLTRSGWKVLEGWPSRFDGDAARAAVVLIEEQRRTV